MERTFYGYWTCDYCGQENRGDEKTCQSCGKTRGKDVKFYINPKKTNEPRVYIEDYQKNGPDWVCSYCDSMNQSTETHCKNCGHPRDGGDRNYHEHHPERIAMRRYITDFDDDYREISKPVSEEPKEIHHEESKEDTWDSINKDTTSAFPSGPNIKFPSASHIFKTLSIGILIIALVFSMFYIFIPREYDLSIVDKTWERQVAIEEYRTLHEEDWSIPPGGRMTGSYRAIHHYEDVFDHYDTVTRSQLVPDGGHYEIDGYTDNGDGTFTERSHWVTDYKTEYYTEQEPVYRSEPVYQTKYQYDIERWVFDYYETTSGHDDEPYFAKPSLDSKHRTAGTTESYKITATYETKRGEVKTDTYSLSFIDWQSVKIGDIIHAKVHFGKRIEIII